MPRGLWDQEWLNQNSQRAYPLAEGTSRLDEGGSVRIPDDLLLELYLPVGAGPAVAAEKFFVRSLVATAGGLSIGVGYDDGTADPPVVATAALATAAHTEYAAYALAGAGDMADSVGRVVVGSAAGVPPGRYLFSPAAARLDPDCVRPTVRGVSSIVVANGSERSDPLTGDVVLAAGANVRLTVATVDGRTEVRIDAIAGEGLSQDCGCADDPGPCVRTINGVAPTAAGDIAVTGTDCLTVTAGAGVLTLADACSQPCCGCAELEAVTRDVGRLGDGATTLAQFVNRLDAEVSQMQLTVLGARLGDRGCVPTPPGDTSLVCGG